MSEIILIYRQINLKGEKVEHLISLVPQETLMSTIGRICPRSGDEIVIKILDESLPPNKKAIDTIHDMMSFHALEEKQRMEILSLDAERLNPDPLQ